MSKCLHEDVVDIGTFEQPNSWLCMDCGERFDTMPEPDDKEEDEGCEDSQIEILAGIRDILSDMRIALIKIAGIE